MRAYRAPANAVLRTTVRKLEGAEEFIGECQSIQSVRDLIARVASTNSTVLITGETGTRKELVARAIHRNSLTDSGGAGGVDPGETRSFDRSGTSLED
jgi:DNA-binding NtrC family response regulator